MTHFFNNLITTKAKAGATVMHFSSWPYTSFATGRGNPFRTAARQLENSHLCLCPVSPYPIYTIRHPETNC